MTTYTKSYATDFGSSFNQSQFHNEIVAEAGITPTLQGIDKTDDVIDITFDSSLSAGEQTTLDGLVSAHAPSTNTPGAIFDAICDTSGNGDYLVPSAAFADGHVSVFMRNGIYVETADIVIPNYGSLTGESGPNTVVYFPGVAKQIKVDGSGGTQETAGTVSITTGTKAITGSGTTFTNITITGQEYILLGTNYFKVASIESATALTLVDTYQGATLSAVEFVLQTMHTGNQLKNFIITGSTTAGLHVRGCRHFVLDSLAIRGNNPNICVEYSGDSSLKHILSETSAGVGLALNHVASIGLSIVDIYNHASHGMEITGISTSVILNGCESSNNGGTGIRVLGTATDVSLTDCVLKYNKANGIVTNSTSHAVMIDSATTRGNTLKGMEIDGSEHELIGNVIEDNGGIGVDVVANNCVISGNVLKNNAEGVKLTGNKNIASGNQCLSNTNKGIHVLGDDSIISTNISYDNADGLLIDTGATDTIATYNNLKGNTSANSTDNGTTSTVSGNKT